MHAEEAVMPPVESGGNLLQRQAGGVGGEQRIRRQMRHDAVEQRRLDGQILSHRLDDPVAAGQLGQIVLKVARSNQSPKGRLIERCRPALEQCTKRGFGKRLSVFILRNHVE